MTIEITGKNIDITPAIRERIEFKFNKRLFNIFCMYFFADTTTQRGCRRQFLIFVIDERVVMVV